MLNQFGLWGLFLGCFLSATIIPFSSEALVTGALLLDYSPWTVILVATLGNTLGGMTCYLLGWLCKWSWIEKYLKIKEENLEKAHQKVEKYGSFAALLTWIPIIGDPIALAMGLMRTRVVPTTLLMFIGKELRYMVVAGLLSALI
ncbi:MAG: DedA family protein [Bacteroidales bacterium]|nr:DedA family protein [Bacteroidales bacterium]